MTPPAVESPFCIWCDDREDPNYRYTFEGLRADAADEHALIVPRVEVHRLLTGDYTISTHAGDVGIERKSLSDLYGTLSAGRQRFEAELERLAEFQFSAVVVEATLADIAYDPPPHSRFSPKCAMRSIFAFQVRYRTQWIFAGDRRMAEATTYRLLERFWRDAQKRAKQEAAA